LERLCIRAFAARLAKLISLLPQNLPCIIQSLAVAVSANSFQIPGRDKTVARRAGTCAPIVIKRMGIVEMTGDVYRLSCRI
jgi:hypothetical protein